jgi:hypothetical protein
MDFITQRVGFGAVEKFLTIFVSRTTLFKVATKTNRDMSEMWRKDKKQILAQPNPRPVKV